VQQSASRDNRGRSQSVPVSTMLNWNNEQGLPSPTPQPVIKTKLQLVDLAGSECVGEFIV